MGFTPIHCICFTISSKFMIMKVVDYSRQIRRPKSFFKGFEVKLNDVLFIKGKLGKKNIQFSTNNAS